MVNFRIMRENMVDGQILPNKIRNQKLVAAMSEVPREFFVGEEQRAYSYSDKAIEIGVDRFMMEPQVFAGLVQALSPDPNEIGLDVGCGSGYGTAILAKLCDTVVGIDSDAALIEVASALLTDLEIDNALTIRGCLRNGYLNEAPYDIVLIEGSVPAVPEEILNQLAEGGRLAAVISPKRGLYEATLTTRVGNSFGSRVLFNTAAPPLPDFDMASGFSF